MLNYFQKLTGKILGLVLINAVGLLAVAVVAWLQIGGIGHDMDEIVNVHDPLINELHTVLHHQVVQEVELEKALRAAEVYKDSAARQRHVGDHLERFQTSEDTMDSSWTVAQELLARIDPERLAPAAGGEDESGLAERLAGLHQKHEDMEKRAAQILETLMIGGRVLPSVTEVLEKQREDFNVELNTIVDEIRAIGTSVAAKAQANQAAALTYLGLFALIAFGVSIVWGWWTARDIAEGLRGMATRAEDVSNQMLAAVQEQRASTNETASAITQTTSTLDEFRQTAQSTAEKAQAVAEAAEQSMATSQQALDAVAQGITAMSDIRTEVEGIARNILDLSEKNIQISEIVQSVNAIAEQSNLLAVNASIEAAKAGEHGKGFSVVASEVRSLASQSKEATAQIRTILSETQKASNAAVMVTEQGTKRVLFGAGLIEELGQTIQGLADTIEESFEAGRNISLTANQQLAGVEQIASAMRNVEQAGMDNAAGAEELENAAHQVQEVSLRLTGIVEGQRNKDTGTAG